MAIAKYARAHASRAGVKSYADMLIADHGKGMHETDSVNHEIEAHKHDISGAHEMASAAQNPAVRTLVQQSIPVLQKHLDTAQRLASKQ